MHARLPIKKQYLDVVPTTADIAFLALDDEEGSEVDEGSVLDA